jgi:hypothetical protein
MTQNEKDLLLKDLCARLPYGVICKDDYAKVEGKLVQIGINYDMCLLSDDYGKTEFAYIPNCKPYLFPLSSMTEEQIQEYTYIVNYISSDDTENWVEGEFIYVEQFTQLMHFYHTNHLDYMGLIPMGMAIDATGLNIY